MIGYKLTLPEQVPTEGNFKYEDLRTAMLLFQQGTICFLLTLS